MTHVATAPHEVEGNFIFCAHGLSPYWILSKLLLRTFDGYSGEAIAEINGEEWTVDLTYQEGGIQPLRGTLGGGFPRIPRVRVCMAREWYESAVRGGEVRWRCPWTDWVVRLAGWTMVIATDAD